VGERSLLYITTEEGWLYCAAHKDLFNGEIVGYALGSRITANLVRHVHLHEQERQLPMTTPRLRASGAHSRVSLSITCIIEPGKRLSGRSANTLKSSTTGNDVRNDSAIYPRPLMKGSSMPRGLQHEKYWCPLLTSEVSM
jgi:hypothetical protein